MVHRTFLFSESALYAVQTMPLVRPAFTDLLGAIDFAIFKDCPGRGEHTGAV